MCEIILISEIMVEVQFHGFTFEKRVRDTFFNGYVGNYMQKWDIPPEINKSEQIPQEYQNVAVSVKSAKYGSPIGLGDARRQRTIDIPFLMIVGFWKQINPSEKWFVEIGVALFNVSDWNDLWGGLNIEEISKIDSQIKDMRPSYSEGRALAKSWKHNCVLKSGCKLVINPKIDSKTQRRIQCSIPFSTFWQFCGHTPSSTDAPRLFGVAFKNPVISEARRFNRD